jgi:drug/metabolite transporter (DMT)-like permease
VTTSAAPRHARIAAAVRPPPPRALVMLAFASVYLAWGSTYLAIRVAVASFPPPVLAGVRFTIAGAGLLVVLRLGGWAVVPGARDLAALAVVGTLLLVCGNGLVVWAEQSVPSGLAALIVATVPLWMAGLAALPPARERLPARAVVGLALGFAGVAVLVAPGRATAGPVRGEVALLVAALSWSCGSLYARRATAAIDPLVATGWEMLIGGGLFLVIAAGLGSAAAMRPTAIGTAALLYLVVFGSWIGFTAYVWLLAHVPAAKVATYAYVNPVIALALGWWILDERMSLAVALGSAIIVVAVVLVTTARVTPRAAASVRAGTAGRDA